jgi:hypothetical protein
MLSRQWAYNNQSQWCESNLAQWEPQDIETATIYVALKRCYYYVTDKMSYYWVSRQKKAGRGRT